jgi:hypothetical protein
MFARGSRYEKVEDAQIEMPSGRKVVYKRRRLIPETAGRLPYQVQADDRLDLVAHKAFRDPEQYWRLCDANRVLEPNELLENGRIILIPIPSA